MAFGNDTRLLGEVTITGNKVGANERFWAILAHHEEVFRKTVGFVFGLIGQIFVLLSTFDRDMRNEGWTLERDTPGEGEFTPELAEFLKEGETYVVGTEMEKRIKDDLCAGQRHLEAMLRNQEEIPVEWRKYVLVAPRTVWLGSGDGRGIPCLYWDGKRWCLGFRWLGRRFSSLSRVVRLGKYQK